MFVDYEQWQQKDLFSKMGKTNGCAIVLALWGEKDGGLHIITGINRLVGCLSKH